MAHLWAIELVRARQEHQAAEKACTRASKAMSDAIIRLRKANYAREKWMGEEEKRAADYLANIDAEQKKKAETAAMQDREAAAARQIVAERGGKLKNCPVHGNSYTKTGECPFCAREGAAKERAISEGFTDAANEQAQRQADYIRNSQSARDAGPQSHKQDEPLRNCALHRVNYSEVGSCPLCARDAMSRVIAKQWDTANRAMPPHRLYEGNKWPDSSIAGNAGLIR